MSGIRREHVRVLNVDDETGHMEPRSAAGVRDVTAADAEAVAEVVTATGGRSRRVADGASVPRVAHNGGAQIASAHHGGARIGSARITIARNGDALNGNAHSRIARDGVPHADVLDGTRHDTDGPDHRTPGPERRTSAPESRTPGPESRTAALTSAPTIRSGCGRGRGAANAGRPTEAGR
ncbi:hypothetical protein [Streptomyces phaeochromogenes]|uniref:hypothetical protein n=1 Tax=Streptomyces phaeochromogenes TaxID=1923 RepID=UPI00386830BC|nr:hypothetical protein OG277_38815 [Streptomyces phaeochromogenes]